KTGDLETSRRAGEILRKLEDKLLTAQMLAPKLLRLKLQDKPVLEAVAELSRLSGYKIEVMGDRTVLANKKITLETGETTFFETVDALCKESGWVETATGSGFANLQHGNIDPGRNLKKALKELKLNAPALPPQVLPVVPPPVPPPPPALQVGAGNGIGN